MDTGSNTTWVQGEGCINCFSLTVGNFKYAESRINSLVSCDDPCCFPRICQDNLRGCAKGTCKLPKCSFWGWLRQSKYSI